MLQSYNCFNCGSRISFDDIDDVPYYDPDDTGYADSCCQTCEPLFEVNAEFGYIEATLVDEEEIDGETFGIYEPKRRQTA